MKGRWTGDLPRFDDRAARELLERMGAESEALEAMLRCVRGRASIFHLSRSIQPRPATTREIRGVDKRLRDLRRRLTRHLSTDAKAAIEEGYEVLWPEETSSAVLQRLDRAIEDVLMGCEASVHDDDATSPQLALTTALAAEWSRHWGIPTASRPGKKPTFSLLVHTVLQQLELKLSANAVKSLVGRSLVDLAEREPR